MTTPRGARRRRASRGSSNTIRGTREGGSGPTVGSMGPDRRPRRLAAACALTVLALASGTAAVAGSANWAAPQIRAVTQQGVLGSSPEGFAPEAPLTQGALADAVRVTDAVQHAATLPGATPPK